MEGMCREEREREREREGNREMMSSTTCTCRKREGGSCEVLLSFLACIHVGLLANCDACYGS